MKNNKCVLYMSSILTLEFNLFPPWHDIYLQENNDGECALALLYDMLHAHLQARGKLMFSKAI